MTHRQNSIDIVSNTKELNGVMIHKNKTSEKFRPLDGS